MESLTFISITSTFVNQQNKFLDIDCLDWIGGSSEQHVTEDTETACKQAHSEV